ncbi:FxsA family protein [uncultured Thiothrix sp.]|uniref:FxsA family protein n=1 Tax=uncultured Thiothrix sp. TaxID=223185 RepID=UPI002624440C|nr:FxsA family protein [uncultured Thiothrix sp.]
MRTLPILALLFFAVPLIEIYLLIQVGHVIGALPTILLVIATSVLGAYLLKQQGLAALARFQNNLRQGQLPADELKEGIFIVLGGILLMTPGFFTDFLGLFCLLPPTRKLLMKLFAKRLQRQSGVVYNDVYIHSNSRVNEPNAPRPTPTALEGEYIRKDEP